jgi:hypothetical protein
MPDLNKRYEQRSDFISYLPSAEAREMRGEEAYIKAK